MQLRQTRTSEKTISKPAVFFVLETEQKGKIKNKEETFNFDFVIISLFTLNFGTSRYHNKIFFLEKRQIYQNLMT